MVASPLKKQQQPMTAVMMIMMTAWIKALTKIAAYFTNEQKPITNRDLVLLFVTQKPVMCSLVHQSLILPTKKIRPYFYSLGTMIGGNWSHDFDYDLQSANNGKAPLPATDYGFMTNLKACIQSLNVFTCTWRANPRGAAAEGMHLSFCV